MERMTGIEPALSAWEAEVLPLNYIRALELGRKAISGLPATPAPMPVSGIGFQRMLRRSV
jgi:hypothetical protein